MLQNKVWFFLYLWMETAYFIVSVSTWLQLRFSDVSLRVFSLRRWNHEHWVAASKEFLRQFLCLLGLFYSTFNRYLPWPPQCQEKVRAKLAVERKGLPSYLSKNWQLIPFFFFFFFFFFFKSQ